jgi:hypothetical protein
MKYILMCAMLALSLSGQAKSLTDVEVGKLMDKISNAGCEGNDSGGTSNYDKEKFNAKKAKKALRKENNGCKGVKMSSSQKEAVESFGYYMNGGNEFASCVKGALSETEREQFLAMVMDPANVGVFSAQYNGNDESEACDFHHFDVYRASGLKVSIVRDDTD